MDRSSPNGAAAPLVTPSSQPAPPDQTWDFTPAPPEAQRHGVKTMGDLKALREWFERRVQLEPDGCEVTVGNSEPSAEGALAALDARVYVALDAYFGPEWRRYSPEDQSLVRFLMARALSAALAFETVPK